MPSKWVEFVKLYAKKNNKAYGCALSDPKCSEEYKKSKKNNNVYISPYVKSGKREEELKKSVAFIRNLNKKNRISAKKLLFSQTKLDKNETPIDYSKKQSEPSPETFLKKKPVKKLSGVLL